MNRKFTILLLQFLIFLDGRIDGTQTFTSSKVPDNVNERWEIAKTLDRNLQVKEISPEFVHRGGKLGRYISGNYKVHLKSMERIHSIMDRLPKRDTRSGTLVPVKNTLNYEVYYENEYLVGSSLVIDLLDVLRKDGYLPKGFVAKIQKLRPESYFSTRQIYTGWIPILTKMKQGTNKPREAMLSEIETKVFSSNGLMQIFIVRKESEDADSPAEGALNEEVKENREK